MKQDRFLIGILIGIVLLIFAALSVFFARQKQVDYGPEDSPQGILQNFILAINQRDFERAYGYLSEGTYKPTLEQFRKPFLSREVDVSSSSLQIGQAEVYGDNAYITVSIVNQMGGPFGDINRISETAQLKKQNGVWKVVSLPYPYWYWDWYQATPSKYQQ